MALQRIASLETFVSTDGRRRRDSDASMRSRRLTFNPLPEAWDPAVIKEDPSSFALGAFEVPAWKRVAQVLLTTLYCLFSSGIVFGFAALKPVLLREGVYREACEAEHPGDGAETETCMELRLNFMYTVAAVGTNVAALPVGAILDYWGPRVCGVMGGVLLALGSLLLSSAQSILRWDAYLPGYLLLALGGSFIYMSSLHLSNAFPQRSGLILAVLTSVFDTSCAVFLGYRLLYERVDGSLPLSQFFRWYLLVPLFIIVLQLTFLPVQSYKTVGELVEVAQAVEAALEGDQVDEHTALLAEDFRQQHTQHTQHAQYLNEASPHRQQQEVQAAEIGELVGSRDADRQAQEEQQKNQVSGVWGVLHGRSAGRQIGSVWFLLICLFTMIQMVRINFFIATIRSQYAALLGTEFASKINTAFDVSLPLCGVLSIPMIGLLLDYTSTVTVLTVLVSAATMIGALGLLPYAWAAYLHIVLFCLYRPLYYTAVSDFTAKVFGFQTFGTVYGAIICLSGLGNFSQVLLDYFFYEVLEGNPNPVNMLLLVLAMVVGMALVGFVVWQVKKKHCGVKPHRIV